MKYKLIALDMDGTLLDDTKQIPQRNIDALFAAAGRGCLIVPATGRMYSGLPSVLQDERLRYHILINGALVYDSKEDRAIHTGCIPCESAAALCRWLDKLPVIYDCYIDNEGFMQADMHDAAEPFFESSRNMYRYVMDTRTKVDCLANYMEERGSPVQKMQIYFRPRQEDLRRELMEKVPREFAGFAATTSLPNNIELNSVEAGKDRGLKKLCAAVGISTEECVVFGDGSNDLGIIRTAGLGVAMENGEEQVKNAADVIAKSNNDCGVALFIEELIATGQI